jgi:hypothetical protein
MFCHHTSRVTACNQAAINNIVIEITPFAKILYSLLCGYYFNFLQFTCLVHTNSYVRIWIVACDPVIYCDTVLTVHLLIAIPMYCNALYSLECFSDAFLCWLIPNFIMLPQFIENWQLFKCRTWLFWESFCFQKHTMCRILLYNILIGLHITWHFVLYLRKCVCDCNHN